MIAPVSLKTNLLNKTTSSMHSAFATILPNIFPIKISAFVIGAAMRRSPVLRIRSPLIKLLAPIAPYKATIVVITIA